jgi:ketosteroid isomerase-like protein
VDAFVAMFREAWSEWRFVPERLLDAGEQVVVFARIVAVGHESHVPIERKTTHVWTIRDGRARSIRIYPNRSDALEAVGLSE